MSGGTSEEKEVTVPYYYPITKFQADSFCRSAERAGL